MNSLIQRHSSQRLQTWNYQNSGKYFVTICCPDKKCFFSDSQLRQRIINIFKLNAEENNIKIDTIVVSVNHIHLIIELNELSKLNLSQYIGKVKVRITQFLRLNYLGQASLSLRETNAYKQPQIWQRSFYDHIIRNDRDFLEKAEYIENHPLKEEGNISAEWH